MTDSAPDIWSAFTAAEAMSTTADAPVLTFYDGAQRVARVSRRELQLSVESVSVYLLTKCVQRGERVAILAPNLLEVPILVLALLRLGAVVVPLNPSSSAEDWAFVMAHSGARALFATADLLARAQDVRVELREPLEDLLTRAASVAPRTLSHDAVVSGSPGATAVLLYTSGTTGRPKGVALSQAAILANARGMVSRFGLSRETQLAVLPLYHAHAFGFGLMTSLLSGGHLVFTKQFDPLSWTRIAHEEAVSVASVVPTLLPLLLQARVRQARVPSLRALLVSSAPLSRELACKFEDESGISLVQGWGLSEYTNFACCLDPRDDAERRLLLRTHEVPSVGTCLDGTEVDVLGADGRSLPERSVGELAIRGPCVMNGYWNDADTTASVLVAGSLRTGDQGYFQLDARNRKHFFVTGRIKEIIIRAGEKFGPGDIEARLIAAAPALASKLVVLGFPHEFYGEEVGAYVEDASESGELARLALQAARALAEPCRPKIIVFGSDPVPRTHTGKVKRRSLVGLFSDCQRARNTEPQARPLRSPSRPGAAAG